MECSAFFIGFSVSPHFVRLRLPILLVTVCHAALAGLWIPDFVVDGAMCPAASAGLWIPALSVCPAVYVAPSFGLVEDSQLRLVEFEPQQR